MLALKRRAEYDIITICKIGFPKYINEILEADKMNKITAIYVRRSVSDKDKGNNSLRLTRKRKSVSGISAKIPITEFTVTTERAERT